MKERYLEDFKVGDRFKSEPLKVTEKQVIEFAHKFDPQMFHLNRRSAERTIFKGLIASGWHTAALLMRLYATHYLSHVASLASPGLDELRWYKPVRPGDELSIRVRILEANRSRTKPDRGMVRTLVEVFNQSGEVVMSLKAMNILLCRSPA